MSKLRGVPTFRHKRTGKVFDVDIGDVYRYRNNRYEQISEGGRIELPPGEYRVTKVPGGTVAEVLDWVGIDDNRRLAALAVERAGKNRKGIIEALS